MRVILVFFLLQSSNIFAQNYYPIEKTPFNKFVEEKEIEWAIYKNDTLFTDVPDLKDLLIRKMKANKIKTFRPLGVATDQEMKIIYTSPEENEAMVKPICELPVFDSLGNFELTKKEPNYAEPKGEINLCQILYIKKGIIFSNINRVSPIINLITTSGINLGKAYFFSTALNNKLENFNSKNDKIISLKKTTTEINVDSIKKEDKLKEMFGHNLIETLWPYIETNKISCYTLPDNNRTTINAIQKQNLLKLETIDIPMYDSLGKLSGTKLIKTDIKATIFDKISITQEWFYNETQNIVFCKIPFAIISVKKNYKADSNDKSLGQIKLVF